MKPYAVFMGAVALSLCMSAGGSARAEDNAGAKTQPEAAPVVPAYVTRSQKIEELYSRLATAKDADEAGGIVGAIGRLFAQSESDTGDLLLMRAHKAMQDKDFAASEEILDSLVKLMPDWAEGWNARATARFLADDFDGSMADVAETLKREPRHLGALSGMGIILEARGQREQALKVYERALSLAPHWRGAEEPVARLKAALAGQSL